ncbi:YARHG domain-containing protein, partial [Salmonella enterica]
MGTKGTLMDYGSYLAFAPQIKRITLEGRFPEASRTWLPVRSVQTRATSIADLKIMLNEIYARHGYIFRPGGEMERYFRQQSWYRPRYANVDYLITETEHR